DNIGPFVVPEDAYFVMGDNRDMSLDSRYWGFLDRNLITGTPSLIVFSTGEPPTKDVRSYILKQRGQFKEKSRIRWERTFKFIK
ncbi:MAG TPA: signal peptidase I, partial [Candidatus Cloacimonetes bacterium]|nr:signal peptidase I [Candidatus Cloacimonadota bacterium]